MKGKLLTISISILLYFVLSGCDTSKSQQNDEQWIDLLSEDNIKNWRIKFAGYPLDSNFNNTFIVEPGLIKVDYRNYILFNGEYGHIFYDQPFSQYQLTMEYRFTGDQVKGGAGWAYRNSGIMLHSQSPQSMGLNQDFPVSLEAQFLGGNGTDDRSTMNLCTPGTHVYIKNELRQEHCINSTSQTFHGDQWVKVQVFVWADSLVQHLVNDKVVIEYTNPVIGGGAVNNFDSLAIEDGTPLSSGHLALQAESHPVEFRNIKLKLLDN